MRRRPIRRIRRRTLRRTRRRFRRRRLLLGNAVILFAGSQIVKLNRSDVERIEEAAGKTAEDLSEDELLAAMKKLGIHRLELTSEDEDAIDAAGEADEA